ERDAHRQRLAQAVLAQHRVSRAEVVEDGGCGDDKDCGTEHGERRVQYAAAGAGAHEEEEEKKVRDPGERVVRRGEEVCCPESGGRAPRDEGREWEGREARRGEARGALERVGRGAAARD